MTAGMLRIFLPGYVSQKRYKNTRVILYTLDKPNRHSFTQETSDTICHIIPL
jgi:hypothetical protein